jgi:hypothetical protein
MADVPAELRTFRPATWLPLTAPGAEPAHWPPRSCATSSPRPRSGWRRWAQVHGYPDGDPIPWLRDHYQVPTAIRRKAPRLPDEDDFTPGD